MMRGGYTDIFYAVTINKILKAKLAGKGFRQFSRLQPVNSQLSNLFITHDLLLFIQLIAKSADHILRLGFLQLKSH